MNGDSCAFIQLGCIRSYQSANYQCTTCSIVSYSASGTGPGACDHPWYLYPQIGVDNTFLLLQTKKQGSFLLFFMLLQTKDQVSLCKESCFFLVCNNQKLLCLN